MDKTIPGLKEIIDTLPEFELYGIYDIKELVIKRNVDEFYDVRISLKYDDSHMLVIECYVIRDFSMPVFYNPRTTIGSVRIDYNGEQKGRGMWFLEDYENTDLDGYCRDIFIRIEPYAKTPCLDL